MDNSPTKAGKPSPGIRLVFADLEDETAPAVALYALDDRGRPVEKLAQARGDVLPVAPAKLAGRVVAIGPDVDDFAGLEGERLLRFRGDQVAALWAKEGLTLAKVRWTGFRPIIRCVSGRVRKCRPWWWDRVSQMTSVAVQGQKLSRTVSLNAQASAQVTLAASVGAGAALIYPWRCVPLCDGIVEVYERQCCCVRVHVPDLIGKLRDIVERIPVSWPPIPIPEPDPAPWAALRSAVRQPRREIDLKAQAGAVKVGTDAAFAPPERLYEAYLDLQRLPLGEAERYALDRVWLHPFFCTCSSRKVGEVAIQPGGNFDLCYRRGRVPPNCWLTYAYRVRQSINGVWVTVYNGISSGAWFSPGEDAELRVTDPRSLPCGDPPGDGPPGDGTPFVMLEHVTGAGTHHFNFPGQTGVSQVGALDVDDGLFTTGYAPDCPWGAGLGLRLWVSPELEGTVAFYRMSVVPVNAAGSPVGAPQPLPGSVAWSRFVFDGTNWVTQADVLGPVSQGAESGLFMVPYWSGGKNWLSGQYHQNWNTSLDANGRYLLIVELFDTTGTRIKPNAAPGPGTGKAFQFRRWTSDTVTGNVAFADCAHVFWVDNTPVAGDIVDLRQNGIANSDECQFMKGTGADTFSIGYRAYHVNGVSNSDSFMYSHGISWQRGLNGPTGTLAPAVGATIDAGELPGPVAQSGTKTFGAMLDADPVPHQRCTFSVHLEVQAKHWNGASRLSGYDYNETASFALDQS